MARRLVRRAQGFATLYGATGSRRITPASTWTGRHERDYREPVMAVANGDVVYAGTLSSTWGPVVVVKHATPDGFVWSRYAHLEGVMVKAGDAVVRGQRMALIGTYTSPATTNHHLTSTSPGSISEPGPATGQAWT